MDTLQLMSLALGAAWASGINLYAAVLILGGLGATGAIDLPGSLAPLESPPVLIIAGLLYAVEFVADKVPGVDSLWDAVHSFIRVPAGGLLAAGTFGDMGAGYEVAAALVAGAVVAAGSHATKAGSRALINTSPEPVTNWAASIAEDVLVVVGLALALFKPVLFFGFFVMFLLFAAWLLPRVLRGLRALYIRVSGRRDDPSGGGPAATGGRPRRGFTLSPLSDRDE